MLYNRPNLFFKKYSAWSPLFIRLIAGFHLIYGVADNVINPESMMAFIQFLNIHHVTYSIAAYVSVYAQLICGICFILGCFQRTSSLIMIINFAFALIIAHVGDSYNHMFPALFMLASSFSLFFSGAGKLSIDQYRNRKFRNKKKHRFN